MAQFSVNADALRPVQELQVPGEVGRPVRRRASARSACSSAPPRWSSTATAATPAAAASRRAAPSTTRSRSSAASPTTSTSSSGPTRCGTTARAWASEVSLKDFRKDVIIEVYNEAGQLAIAYKVYRCWVSEFQALPDLDANANAVAIQHIKLENEGWERDYEVTGAEPSPRSSSRARDADGRDRPRAGCSACGSAGAARHAGRVRCRRCSTLYPATAPTRRRQPRRAAGPACSPRRPVPLVWARAACAACGAALDVPVDVAAVAALPVHAPGEVCRSRSTARWCASGCRRPRTCRTARRRPRTRSARPAAAPLPGAYRRRGARARRGRRPRWTRRWRRRLPPGRSTSLVACPDCATTSAAALDVALLLWAEVEARATVLVARGARAGPRVRLDRAGRAGAEPAAARRLPGAGGVMTRLPRPRRAARERGHADARSPARGPVTSRAGPG